MVYSFAKSIKHKKSSHNKEIVCYDTHGVYKKNHENYSEEDLASLYNINFNQQGESSDSSKMKFKKNIEEKKQRISHSLNKIYETAKKNINDADDYSTFGKGSDYQTKKNAYKLNANKDEKKELKNILNELKLKLDQLNSAQEFFQKRDNYLINLLNEFENATDINQNLIDDLKDCSKLYKISLSSVFNYGGLFIDLADLLTKKITNLLELHDYDDDDDSLFCLMKEKIKYKQYDDESNIIKKSDYFNKKRNSKEDDISSIYSNVFHDALDNVSIAELFQQNESNQDSKSDTDTIVEDKLDTVQENNSVVEKKTIKNRRKKIPPRPNRSINVMSILKSVNGKDLSTMPVPVNFNEPLSVLQRISEGLEYSQLLDIGAKCQDRFEQMAYVAAFAISSYSTSTHRMNKPFNPLLGETYEFDRVDDLGWRCVSEQVSHHPPISAMHAESINGWKFFLEAAVSIKFKGHYLLIAPTGSAHIEFTSSGDHYTMKRVNSYVNNIILGKMWFDHVGEVEIVNHTTKDVCYLKFHQSSNSHKERKVTGTIVDSNNTARMVLSGNWSDKMEYAPVIVPQSYTESTKLVTGEPKLLWKRNYGPEYLESMYNFSEFAVQLNEPEENVAPTDTRLRPDQRLMEETKWDEANEEKVRLEEKQRRMRKQRELTLEEYKPVWFKKSYDVYTHEEVYTFNNQYWECKKLQDWSQCPNLF